MAGKIGIEGQVPTPALAAAIKAGGWAGVKMIGDTSMLAVAANAGVPIRMLREYGTDDMAPDQAADRISTYDLRPVTAIQLLCETGKAWDVAWQADFRDALWSRGWRGAVLAVDTSTGNPTQFDTTTHPPDEHYPLMAQTAPLFMPGAVGKTAGSGLPTWLGLDGYTPFAAGDPRYPAWVDWTAERDAKDVACLLHHGLAARPFVVYAESGVDQTAPGVPAGGYLLRMSPDDFVATVIDLDRRDAAKPWLLARIYFDASPTPDWIQKGFDLRPVLGRLADYQKSTAPNNWQPQLPAKGPAPVLTGIDVSTYQMDPANPQPVDWAQVAASGRQFGWCKATEGYGYTDPQFQHNWPGIRGAGLIRGCYHYARPDLGNRPEDEVAFMLARVGAWQPGDFFALDIEDPRIVGDMSAWVRGWFDALVARTGARKLLYSYASFLAAHNLTQASLGADVTLILAAYQGEPPAAPAGWDRYAIWQHADDVVVPGVQKPTDEDYCYLDAAGLRALGVPGGSTVDQDAQTYYFSRGHTVNTTFALWNVALEPLYAFWRQLKAQGNPLADLVAPGPLVSDETPTTWGNGQPASYVRLTNREVGVYQDTAGAWHPYQLEF